MNKSKFLKTNVEILEELKTVLQNDENIDNNCISIYDIKELLRKKRRKMQQIEEKYVTKIKERLKVKLHEDSCIIKCNKCYQNELKLTFIFCDFNQEDDGWQQIYFSKKDDIVYLTKVKGNDALVVFNTLKDILGDLYDEYDNFSDYTKYYKFHINPVNSNFDFLISGGVLHPYIEICTFNLFGSIYSPTFWLKYSSNGDYYNSGCIYNEIRDIVKGNENKIFKKICVNIEECPEWMKQELYDLRKVQLVSTEKQTKNVRYKLK